MKKLLRSLLVFAPGIQDARFSAEARVLRALRRPFRPDFAGLRALGLTKPVVLDIGCNRGISISTIRTMLPDARIVGYEANTALAGSTALMFADDPQIEVRPIALGAERGSATLHVPSYRGYRFDGLASFDPATAGSLFDDRLLYGLDRKHLVIDGRPVPVRRLDDESLDGGPIAPDLIKLYVQGHECRVLDGASRTIERHEPIVIAPARHDEVDAWMRGRGYRRYRWLRGRFEPEGDGGYVVYYATAKRTRSLVRSGV